MKHAEVLIERILFLDATPNLTKHLDITVGKNVKEQVESDLRLETEAVAMYNRAIETAREGGDNASRELFERLLKDEEEHVDWLEAANAPNKRTRVRALSKPADQRRRVTSLTSPTDVQKPTS
jgi:bacterioferritin